MVGHYQCQKILKSKRFISLSRKFFTRNVLLSVSISRYKDSSLFTHQTILIPCNIEETLMIWQYSINIAWMRICASNEIRSIMLLCTRYGANTWTSKSDHAYCVDIPKFRTTDKFYCSQLQRIHPRLLLTWEIKVKQ
jgi:hypothetical protein